MSTSLQIRSTMVGIRMLEKVIPFIALYYLYLRVLHAIPTQHFRDLVRAHTQDHSSQVARSDI